MKLAILVSIVFAFASADSSICVTRTFQYCQQVFGESLNVSQGSDLWNNPATFNYIIQSYYKKGVDGLLAVCQARQQFYTCLGDAYDMCISVNNFISNGKTPSDAKSFVGNLRVLEFDCDGGFIQSSKHFDCINLATQTKITDLSNCWTSYQNDLKNLVPSCNAATTMVNCLSSVYQNVCGSETSWWECERTRLGQLLDQTCPAISCQLGAPSQLSGTRASRVAQVFNHQPDISRVIKSLVNKN